MFPDGTGYTRDISSHGIFFETVSNLQPGEHLLLGVVLESMRDVGLTVCCEAVVTRIENEPGVHGVAARIESFTFDSFPSWLGVRSH